MSGKEVREVTGICLPLRGDDVDTDQIIPGRFLTAITFEGIEEHVFADERRRASERGGVHPFDEPAWAEASILLVGRNFGCGSSREHAAQALLRRGVRCIVGVSFGAIFEANCANLGLPCCRVAAEDAARLLYAAETSVAVGRVDLVAEVVTVGEVVAPTLLSEGRREQFLRGAWDTLDRLLDNSGEVARRLAPLAPPR